METPAISSAMEAWWASQQQTLSRNDWLELGARRDSSSEDDNLADDNMTAEEIDAEIALLQAQATKGALQRGKKEAIVILNVSETSTLQPHRLDFPGRLSEDACGLRDASARSTLVTCARSR